MPKKRMFAVVVLLAAGFVASSAQDQQLPVSDPICTFFGSAHGKPAPTAATLGALTMRVATQLHMDAMPSAPGGSRTDSQEHSNTIDRNIFQALTAASVAPAPATNDFEFIRRATLDLTGRIPTPDAATAFVNDTTPNKRANLVESLLASPNWVDKWTVWFADLYQNNSRNTQIPRYVPGVIGFNDYIRASLASAKPYDQMAREIISAQGADSYTQGELNFLIGGVVTGGPVQDIFDQQVANTVETFLGISHMNCLLCHNGRGHLDSLSLWGYTTSRAQAWGMASFMSHTYSSRTPVSPDNNQPYYWGLADDTRYKTDYQLNTTTGNRPARTGVLQVSTVPPTYIFDGTKPSPGQNYRAALAQKITSDFQFARATVNYIWEYFFTVGIVSPSNQFDPLRLDPDNPPSNCPSSANPCTLQPSNARLLNQLAQDFINSKYDLKSLMREIVNSQTYQLSSRYNGAWDPSTANLFGRKLVRRLWSEEVHDAIAQSSGIIPTYNNATWGPVNWAMKLPEPDSTPDGAAGAVTAFLDAFLRGNRDDQPRRPDGSISQALGLMNDNFVMSRIKPNGPATSLLVKALAMQDTQMVNTLFLTVLSRYPTAAEMSAALANFKTNRTQEAQNLLWSLYNKVDFIFNY